VDGAAAVLEIVADAQVRDARAVIDLAIADFVLEVSRAIADGSYVKQTVTGTLLGSLSRW
jgi:hypothetical protein